MRHEVMMEMSLEQLDQYGKACGIDVTGKRTRQAKVAEIEKRRSRTAEVDALGMTLTVPVRAMHDKRVTDMLGGQDLTDAQATELMVRLLGDAQYDALVEHCTDDDGVVDVEAMGLAFAAVISSGELKNF